MDIFSNCRKDKRYKSFCAFSFMRFYMKGSLSFSSTTFLCINFLLLTVNCCSLSIKKAGVLKLFLIHNVLLNTAILTGKS